MKTLLSSCRRSWLLLPLFALGISFSASADAVKSPASLEIQLRDAIQSGHPQKAIALLRRGASANFQNGALFREAILLDNQSLVREFLVRGARITPDAMRSALQGEGDGVATTTLFLNRGANPDTLVSYQVYDFKGHKKGAPEAHTLLMVAAEGGKLAAAKLLIARGARVNRRLPNGLTALRVAARSDSVSLADNALDFCRYLLDKGAQFQGAESDLLQLIVDDADPTLFDLLQKRGAFAKPVHWPRSIDRLSLPVAQRLMRVGANPNGNAFPGSLSPLESACRSGDVALARFLLGKGARISDDLLELSIPDRFPSLEERKQWQRVLAGDLSNIPPGRPNFGAPEDDRLLQLLLEHRANPNQKSTGRFVLGQTPLHQAATSNRVGAIRLLLAHGANIEARDAKGKTPLVEALESESDEVIAVLFAAGASVTSRDNDDNTPLFHLLSSSKDTTAYAPLAAALLPSEPALPYVQQLVARGADVRAQNKEGLTPLHVAAEKGMVAIAQFLLEHGALLDAPSHSGRTPLASACASGRFATAKLLFERGANPDAPDATGKTPRQLASEPFTMQVDPQFLLQDQEKIAQLVQTYSTAIRKGRRKIAALFAQSKTTP